MVKLLINRLKMKVAKSILEKVPYQYLNKHNLCSVKTTYKRSTNISDDKHANALGKMITEESNHANWTIILNCLLKILHLV